MLVFVLLAFALIYYFGPDVHQQHWKWITPGAVVGVALWLLVSFAFKAYLSYFNSYSATYGSLGAVIILMLWFYFTGAAILIGGEINSEIENEMAKQGAPDAKEKGEKSPGQKERVAERQRREERRTARRRQRERGEARHGARLVFQQRGGHAPGTRPRHARQKRRRGLQPRQGRGRGRRLGSLQGRAGSRTTDKGDR